MTAHVRYHRVVDAKGEQCPVPILLAKRALCDMSTGQVLLVMCTDPVAPADFARLAARRFCELLGITERDGTFEILVRRQPEIVTRRVT